MGIKGYNIPQKICKKPIYRRLNRGGTYTSLCMSNRTKDEGSQVCKKDWELGGRSQALKSYHELGL